MTQTKVNRAMEKRVERIVSRCYWSGNGDLAISEEVLKDELRKLLLEIKKLKEQVRFWQTGCVG